MSAPASRRHLHVGSGSMRIKDIARLDLGTFIRPGVETVSGHPRVEQVLAYVARAPAGLLLMDTGLGAADQETEAWYRPRRIALESALAAVGLASSDIDLVVNCHLHFDHIGGNPLFAGRPIHCQRRELGCRPRTQLHLCGPGRLPPSPLRAARRRGRARPGHPCDPHPRTRRRSPVGGPAVRGRVDRPGRPNP